MNSSVTRILLVEPEAVLAEVTAFRLELLGYIVRSVNSAEKALEQLEEDIPDLMITNLELPEIDGIALIERVSSVEKTSSLPIMVLSLDADLDHVQAVHQAGGCDFLVVPFQPEVLAEKVARQLERARNNKASDKTKTAAAD